MARNTGSGFRIGAVRNRFQMLNPSTGRYTVFDAASGRILRIIKSGAPAKGIRVILRSRGSRL